MVFDDCYDGYWWLRLLGYELEQIVLVGDFVGGYFVFVFVQWLQEVGEELVVLVVILLLLQLVKEYKQVYFNIKIDVMFLVRVFDVFDVLVVSVVVRNQVDGEFEEFYEFLEYIILGLLWILIYVLGFEVLLYDVQLVVVKLVVVGVLVEVWVWLGQVYDFQVVVLMLFEVICLLCQIGEYICEVIGQWDVDGVCVFGWQVFEMMNVCGLCNILVNLLVVFYWFG